MGSVTTFLVGFHSLELSWLAATTSNADLESCRCRWVIGNRVSCCSESLASGSWPSSFGASWFMWFHPKNKPKKKLVFLFGLFSRSPTEKQRTTTNYNMSMIQHGNPQPDFHIKTSVQTALLNEISPGRWLVMSPVNQQIMVGHQRI